MNRLDHTLLAQRLAHIILGLAVARLPFAARQAHFRRAFFGRVGVEALAFLVALALTEPVGAGLAVWCAVGGHHARRAPGHHQRRLRHIRQALAGILCAGVEIVDGLAWALHFRQDRERFLEQLSHFIDQARIFLARRWRRRGLDLLRRRLLGHRLLRRRLYAERRRRRGLRPR